jgi:hypothetical protein
MIPARNTFGARSLLSGIDDDLWLARGVEDPLLPGGAKTMKGGDRFRNKKKTTI